MKKWLLSIVALCCLVSLSGCTSAPAENALENEFGDQLVLTLKDLDDDENGALYDEITSQLVDYDTVYSRMVPFIVVEDYFAVLAYNKGEETALISDIKAARDGKPLGDTLSNGRWLFKE